MELAGATAAVFVLGALALALAGWILRRRDRRVLTAAVRGLTATDEPGVAGTGPDADHGRDLRTALDVVGERIAAADRRAGAAETNVVLLSNALAAVPHGVVICDVEGSVLYRNTTAAAFVSARHADALAENTVAEVLEAARQGQVVTRALDLFGPPRRRLNISGSQIEAGGRTIGAVAVIEDVSDRLRLEDVRRDFVANVSHELKTPVGALGLLAETLVGEDDAAVTQRLAARMQHEAYRVAGIIDDLLDLSRIEAEESPLRDPIPLQLVVAHAVDRIRPAAEHRGIVLDVDDPPARLQVRGDRRQLTSALYNLLDNAVKYSPDGSTVQVSVRSDGHAHYLVVRDRGIGIPNRDLGRIFERFYRVDRARGRDTGGTGLGLAIVRHVAQKHDGEVLVDSHEGEGSTFTLRLPAIPGPVGLIADAG